MLNADGSHKENVSLTKDQANDALNLFRRSIHNAKVLDGNLILSDGKLVRVSYGSYHGLFAAGAKTRTATENENKSVRDFLRTVLTTYVENMEGLGPAKKAELMALIDSQLNKASDAKPLMRRTIRLLVDAVDGKTPEEQRNEVQFRRELQGSWNAADWKQVGDDDLGVWMTKGQFKSMLQDGLKVAKQKVENEEGADAATVSDRKKALDRLVEHYLKLFDEGKTDGCLGAFVGTAMDPESLGAEMLAQLNQRAFAEKLQGLAFAKPPEDGKVFGIQGLAARAHEISKGRNHVRSLLQRNVVTVKEAMDWSAKLDGRKQRDLTTEKGKERAFIADLIMSAETEKALAFGAKGARVLACLFDNADLFASICLKVFRDGNPKAANKAHPLDNKEGVSVARGEQILKQLEIVSPEFAKELKTLAGALCGKDGALCFEDCRSVAKFKDALFAKMDVIAAKFEEADLEGKIAGDVNKLVEGFAGGVVEEIKKVCDCEGKDIELAIIKKLAVDSCDYDKRRMIAMSIRNSGENGLSRDRNNLISLDAGGFLRGMGVYANKLLQGFKIKSEVDFSYDPNVLAAIKAVHSDLPAIDKELVLNQLEKSLNLGDGTAAIKRIEIAKSLGAGSVAQTFNCKVYLTSGDVTKDVVVKVFRPGSQEEFDRQAKIVKNFVDTYQGKEKSSLEARYYERVLGFKEELNPYKEMVNALWGVKNLGQAMELKTDATNTKTFLWKKPGSKDSVEMKETNYVGSESLVLKAEYATEDGCKKVVEAINAAKTDAEMKNVLETYFVCGSDACMLIECAKGKDLARHTQEITAEIEAVKIGEVKEPNDYKTPLDSYMKPRQTQAKLNRALLQLKHAFLEGALNNPDHTFHADLHKDNLIFDPETGAITVIDYGRFLKLSAEEAEALKLLFKLESMPEGGDVGKTMAEAYRLFLKSELAKCAARAEDKSLSAEEAKLNQMRLDELKGIEANLFAAEKPFAGVAFERELARAYKACEFEARMKDEPSSVLALFKKVMANVAGKALPLPSTVAVFIDSYSRLDNALAEVQNSIRDIDAKITNVMRSYEADFVEKSVKTVLDRSIERVGWFEAVVEGGEVQMKAAATTGKEKSCPGMFTSRLQDHWNKAGRGTAAERRRHLAAMRHLIAAESERLRRLTDSSWKPSITLGNKAVEVAFDSKELQDCRDALAALQSADAALAAELEMLKATITSETLYETNQISPELLEVGNVNSDDLNLRRLPISVEDRLLLSYLKATGAKTLPERLEKAYCQILIGTGANWTELLDIAKAHSPDDFIKLLADLQDDKIKRGDASNLNRAGDIIPAVHLPSLAGKDSDPVDPVLFSRLSEVVVKAAVGVKDAEVVKDVEVKKGTEVKKGAEEKEQIILNPLITYYDKFRPTGYEPLDILLKRKDNPLRISTPPTIRDAKLLLSFHRPLNSTIDGDRGFDNELSLNSARKDFVKFYNEIVAIGSLGREAVAKFKLTFDLINEDSVGAWMNHPEGKLTIGRYLELVELHEKVKQIVEQPADSGVLNVVLSMAKDTAERLQPAESTETVPATNGQTAESTETVPATNVQPAESTETVPATNGQTAESTETVPATNVQPAESTETVPATNGQTAESAKTVPATNGQEAESATTTNAKVGDCLKALGQIRELIKKGDNNEELPSTFSNLYTSLLDWLNDKKNTTFAFDSVRMEMPTIGALRHVFEEFSRIVIASLAPLQISDETYKALFGKEPKQDEVVTKKDVKKKFDELIAGKGYAARQTVGAYDTADLGNSPFGAPADYAALFKAAQKNGIINKQIGKVEKPTNKQVWEFNQEVRDMVDTQPHLNDDKSITRNLFGDPNLDPDKEKLIGTKKAFELEVYNQMRDRVDKPVDNLAWTAQLNERFDSQIQEITKDCQEMAKEAALEVVKDGETFKYVNQAPCFVALRKFLMTDPNSALSNGTPSITINNWQNQPGAEQALFNAMLVHRGWEKLTLAVA